MVVESVSWWLIQNIFTRYIMRLFKRDILDKIKEVIFISLGPPQTNYLKEEVNFIFPLIVDSKSTLPISVKSIRCMFTYNTLILQSLTFRHDDVYATNGVKMELITIKPLDKGIIECPFKPFPYLPVLPEINKGWGIKGIVEFECFYGVFKKEIEYSDQSINPTDKWTKVRSDYQHFYSSLLEKKVKKVIEVY
jgi:hypothetical protein